MTDIPRAGNPLRSTIEAMIEASDLEGLLRQAGALHGHLCNYLTYGVKGAAAAVRDLDVRNTGMEEVVAVLETNNCLADGVQIVSGCTFGNNALVYHDLGRTAFSLVRRGGKGLRYALNADFEDSRAQAYPEAYELWNRLVAGGESGTPQEFGRMMQLFHDMAVKELDVPVEIMFDIGECEVELPPRSVMYRSVRCARCGENATENRMHRVGGKWLCLMCAGDGAATLDSRGISAPEA